MECCLRADPFVWRLPHRLETACLTRVPAFSDIERCKSLEHLAISQAVACRAHLEKCMQQRRWKRIGLLRVGPLPALCTLKVTKGHWAGVTGLNRKLANLQELEISECHSLKVLPELLGLPKLKILRLEHCKSLKKIGVLGPSRSLHCVHVRRCPLQTLPRFGNCAALSKADFVHCFEPKTLNIPDSTLAVGSELCLKPLPSVARFTVHQHPSCGVRVVFGAATLASKDLECCSRFPLCQRGVGGGD